MIKVLCLRSVDGQGGGPERTILSAAAAEDRSRIRTTLVYLRPPGPFWLAERARASGLEYLEIPDQRALDPRAWRRLTSLVRCRRFDLIHSHDHKTDALMFWLARAAGRPRTLSTVHAFDGHLPPGWHAPRLYMELRRRLLPTFDHVAAVSRGLERRVLHAGVSRERVSVLYNGIDTKRFRPRPELCRRVRAELGLDDDHQVIGTFGRLAPIKRTDRLLASVAALRAERPGLRCVVAGEGPLTEQLERRAKDLGIEPICRFLGHRERVERLHCALDVFVSASEWEGLPYAVLEAMAAEVPVVATGAEGNDELIDDGVHGISIGGPGDGELTAAIRRLIDHRGGARRMARAARNRALEEFSATTMHRRLSRLYRRLAADSKPGRESTPGSRRIHS